MPLLFPFSWVCNLSLPLLLRVSSPFTRSVDEDLVVKSVSVYQGFIRWFGRVKDKVTPSGASVDVYEQGGCMVVCVVVVGN